MFSTESPVLVTGAHRSGSTWVGQVLAVAPNLAYLHEPFNPIYPQVPSAPIKLWYLYLHEKSPIAYHDLFTNIFNWKYQPLERLASVNSVFKAKLWLKYAYIFSKSKGKRVCMKDPIALLSLPWLFKNFNVKPVVLTRHPAAFVYSLIRKNWQFPFEDLLCQTELMRDKLAVYEPHIQKLASEKADILEQACLIWNILHSTIADYKNLYKEWFFITHENLSLNPIVCFKEIFAYANLEFTSKVEEFIRETTDAQNPKGTSGSEELLVRDAQANTKYWKEKLSTEQIDKIMELTAAVWPSFYTIDDWN